MAPPIEEFSEQAEAEPLSEVDALVEALGDLSSDDPVDLRVYEKKPGQKDRYLGSLAVNDASQASTVMDTIQRENGPGSYCIRIYAKDPTTGQSRLRTRRDIDIGKSIFVKPNGPQGQNAPAITAETIAAAVVGAIRQAMPQTQTSPFAQMKEMAELVATFMAVMPTAQPQKSLADQLRELRELQQMGAELAGVAPKEPDETAGLIGLGGKVMEFLAASRAQGASPPQGVHVPTPQMPLTQPVTVAKEPQPIDNSEDEDMQVVLMLALKRLMKAAAENQPVEDAADSLLGILDASKQAEESMLEVLQMPSWWEYLVEAAPPAAPHRPYFERLRDEILSRYDPAESDKASG